MFKPLAMKYVELSLLKDDAAQAALLLANYGAFDPEIIEDSAPANDWMRSTRLAPSTTLAPSAERSRAAASPSRCSRPR